MVTRKPAKKSVGAKNGPTIHFTTESKGCVHMGVLTFEDSRTRNAFSKKMIDLLEDHVRKLGRMAQKDELNVLVFYGGPKAFCAGANLKERIAMDAGGVMDFVDRLNDLFERIERLPVITVAAIEGVALGGGFEFALACDLRIVARNAHVGLPEAALGVIPGAGGTYRMLRIAPESVVKESVFAAKRYTASEALTRGLVTQLMPQKGFLAAVRRVLFEQFQKVSPYAVIQAKRAIEAYRHQKEENFRQIERSFYLNTLYSTDRLEGLCAFGEKRAPKFTGDSAWTSVN